MSQHHMGAHQTSASATPAAAAGDPALQSYRVHLDSLQDFARELEAQIDGLSAPTEGLSRVGSTRMALGAFAEADGLVAAEQQTVQQMLALLADVKQAIGFAAEVTRTVSSGYSQADSAVAGGMGSSHAGLGAEGIAGQLAGQLAGQAGQLGSAAATTVQGVGAPLAAAGPAVGQLADSVGGAAASVGGAAASAAQGVTQVVVSIPNSVLGGL